MKGFSSLLLLVAGFLAGPMLVGLTNHFISASPNWFPYLIIMLVAGVVYAVGVDVVRPIAIGMIVGVLAFAVLQTEVPLRVQWLPKELRNVPKPF